MNEKMKSIEENEALSRHQRKCIICHHPHREEIEDEYLHWRPVWRISRLYEISDYRSIYRHAQATGLVLRRREDFRSALDLIIENAADAKVTGDTVIRAIRAHSCLDASGRWTEPPTNVVFTVIRTTRADGPAPIPAAPVRTILREELEPLDPETPPSPPSAPEPHASDPAMETEPVAIAAAASRGDAAFASEQSSVFSALPAAHVHPRGEPRLEGGSPSLGSRSPVINAFRHGTAELVPSAGEGAVPKRLEASGFPTPDVGGIETHAFPDTSPGHSPSPTPFLIYGTGIRNPANALKT